MANDMNYAKVEKRSQAEIVDQAGQSWVYSDIVKDHFFNPRNLLLELPDATDFDGIGMVGSPACGDMMKIWIKVNSKTERITEMKWQTFGCGSAIASTSMMSVMVTEGEGMTLAEAQALRPQDIMVRLDGLPTRKVHCSVLGDKALRKAINDYFKRTNQPDRVVIAGAKVIDKVLNITDHDIEEAVLDGAHDLEAVQAKTKVGTGDPSCLPEVEQLIRFYYEKYYG
ncbi:MAG: NifU-like protein [Candidatus Berkelbacteria bacterium Gr01-1014_85]|uniref:NifU-like protein n=1 Tax=Candidatus Berkelbacteria bacterium Gr01-1014_85 TaxID=2017150 RepID=A0A554JAZ7_9BACT|nr:MAG: NifU-like protein [Candidatus Berkelbacteria bacterium Gr01-1014_85]